LFHANIIKYENRPFSSIDEMHKYIIKKHNAVVGKNDTTFFLGDISFSNKINTLSVVEKLNGKKILIKGNHDTRSISWYIECGFDQVIQFPVIYKEFFILSHEPIYLNDHMPYVNIHGHLHSKKYGDKQYINICVENWDYTPQNLQDLMKLVKES
jgi:calcineurin-like phosphoesterase family protein